MKDVRGFKFAQDHIWLMGSRGTPIIRLIHLPRIAASNVLLERLEEGFQDLVELALTLLLQDRDLGVRHLTLVFVSGVVRRTQCDAASWKITLRASRSAAVVFW